MPAPPDVQNHAVNMDNLDLCAVVMARLCARHEREPD